MSYYPSADWGPPSPDPIKNMTVIKPDPELVALVTELTKCVVALTKMAEALSNPTILVEKE